MAVSSQSRSLATCPFSIPNIETPRSMLKQVLKWTAGLILDWRSPEQNDQERNPMEGSAKMKPQQRNTQIGAATFSRLPATKQVRDTIRAIGILSIPTLLSRFKTETETDFASQLRCHDCASQLRSMQSNISTHTE